MALALVVMMTACNNDSEQDNGSGKVVLSATSVTENSIVVSCNYKPGKTDKADDADDAGYLVFRSDTSLVTDEMRMAMAKAYETVGPCHKSESLVIDSLASNRTYYIMAVTYGKKDGKIVVDEVTTLRQRTMANNDDRVTCSVNGYDVKLTIRLDDAGYTFNEYEALNIADYKHDLNVNLGKAQSVSASGEPNCHDGKGNMVCTVNCKRMVASKKQNFFAYVPDGDGYKKYEAMVTITKNLSLNGSGSFEVVVGSSRW